MQNLNMILNPWILFSLDESLILAYPRHCLKDNLFNFTLDIERQHLAHMISLYTPDSHYTHPNVVKVLSSSQLCPYCCWDLLVSTPILDLCRLNITPAWNILRLSE